MTTRKEILEKADQCVNGSREGSYGKPERSFGVIAQMWNAYMKAKGSSTHLTETDVATMMMLLKISRIATGRYVDDNWVDIAGYAACGGEIQSMGDDEE